MVFGYVLMYFLIGAVIDTFFEIMLLRSNKTYFNNSGRAIIVTTWPLWFSLFLLSLLSDLLNGFVRSIYAWLDGITDRMIKR